MTVTEMLPLWRSSLFVPATSERFIAKAHLRGADAIKIDLEDAVAPTEKARARTLVPAVAASVGQAGADVLVRINRPWRMAVADLEASVGADVNGIVIPKIESADHVVFLEEIVAELEAERGLAPGHTCFTLQIETAKGFLNVREIAGASRRNKAISVGNEDFAHMLGMPETISEALIGAMQTVQMAAREAGILALGYPGSIANFSDLDAYRADIARARALGFDGGSCIHPAQVAILNEGFAPTAVEIAEAEGIIAAYDAALARGEGAVAYQGKMIDIPIADRARRTLAQRDRIAGR
ncbi:MAG: CoA ester lyase [Pseudomonadota bacterium]|nr:CoA ester lyase [Pseudomonadota bacterium]MEC8116147.1 CoA ester lyase [Pseudomonadota bacterium]MEC8674574.1 CoA ester lyase [Pseudomonadota bacterium]MEC9216409.1 CoA ester lyase [Pseudomonadota bacterium]